MTSRASAPAARRPPEGGTVYELPPEGVRAAPPGLLEALDPLVRGVRDNGALVVVHTTPGAAQAVALALDQARLPEVLGTIAGDDTVFVAPDAGCLGVEAHPGPAGTPTEGKKVMNREKIVLAYSGGLDTSVLVRVLSVDYGYDVVCCHADVGEARDAKALSERAKAAGAIAMEMVDAKEEFAKDFCFPALQANALYEGVYPLSAALSRPLIAKHLVDIAHKYGATAVAHGADRQGQ